MTAEKFFIEQQIVDAVRKMLTEKVNEILKDAQFVVPPIEFNTNINGFSVSPVIILSGCERTEKERIIRVDAYSVSVTFELPETHESEYYCYAYTAAVSAAIDENPTLGGVINRAEILNKKYVPPKKQYCGEGWGLVLTLRVTVEDMGNDG